MGSGGAPGIIRITRIYVLSTNIYKHRPRRARTFNLAVMSSTFSPN
jgi:hypothetical protein